MSVTAWLNPSAAVDIAGPGASAWINVNNVLAHDAASAQSFFVIGPENAIFREVKLVKAGIIQSTNKGADITVPDPGPAVFGGAADLWSGTWTAADLNDPNFGVIFALGIEDFSTTPSVKSTDSHYLEVTGFNLGLPPTAVINGIEVQAYTAITASGGGTARVGLESIQIRVTYTWSPKVIAVGSSTGIVYTPLMVRRQPDKRYAYKVYRPGGEFIGEWNDVSSEPDMRQEINNMLTSMDISLARNESSNPGVAMVTENSDVEDNLELAVMAFFGTFEEIVTETGEPIVTEDNELILGEVGAPNGKVIYSGYISDWTLDFGTDDNVVANTLSHSLELDNIMLETEDTLAQSYYPAWTGGSVGIAGGGPFDNETLDQTFTFSGATGKQSRITLPMIRWEGGPVVTLYLFDPSNNLIGIAQATPPDFQSWKDTDFVFPDYVTLVNGTVYRMYFEVDQNKTGGNATYPVSFQTQPGYTGGTMRLQTAAGGGLIDQGTDLRFKIWAAGGNTTVSFTNIDPGALLMRLLDFAKSRGSRVYYAPGSIQLTGTRVNIEFQTNTVLEAINAIPGLCPAGWYTSFDPGINIVSLNPRPSLPSHYAIKGTNASRLQIKRSIRQIVNQVYFSGGGSPALFVKVTDNAARIAWRPGLKKLSDNRVTDAPTGRILSRNEIDQGKNPRYAGTLLLADGDVPVEDYRVGELLGFQAWIAWLDALGLQAVAINYAPDTLGVTLETLPFKENQQLQDVKQSLSLEQQVDNPASPS